jgi:hypothetical protein
MCNINVYIRVYICVCVQYNIHWKFIYYFIWMAIVCSKQKLYLWIKRLDLNSERHPLKYSAERCYTSAGRKKRRGGLQYSRRQDRLYQQTNRHFVQWDMKIRVEKNIVYSNAKYFSESCYFVTMRQFNLFMLCFLVIWGIQCLWLKQCSSYKVL